MPLDAFCLAAVADELSARIIGQKIDKVQQPERDIIILSLRGGNQAPCSLLISAGAGDARVHLTEHRFENPASPPMFCMLLRKHLTSARISGVEQPQSERILELTLETQDAMGVYAEKRLVVEMIGRISNIILIDAGGLIIDCLRRISDDNMERRAVIPGLFYARPPAQAGKIDPLTVTEETWRELYASSSGTADKWLMTNFSALSPLICRELSQRAYGEADFRMSAISDEGSALRREFFSLTGIVESGGCAPWLITGADKTPRDFSYIRITQYGDAFNVQREESFSKMLDAFFTRTAQIARIKQKASATEKTMKTARDKLIRKLTVQREELKKTADRDTLRECGDILTANLHNIRKGQTELVAEDFYSENGGMRKIALDPLKTPQQNAARYYKDYSKAKNAESFLTEQIRLGENELIYIESALGEISFIENERDLNEIRRELTQTGYIRARNKDAGNKKADVPSPMLFVSSTGMTIMAGKNNAQNDNLTLKIAAKTDIWLHAQKSHGAHVIIKGADANAPDDVTLFEAATIAAFYSSARGGGKTPVDYAPVKYVKKPGGGRPGMVVYTDYRTIIVTPDEDLAASLRRDNSV